MAANIKYNPAGEDGLVDQPKLKVLNPKDWQRTNENPAETLAAHEERARELQAGTQYHKQQAGGALSAIAADIKGLAHLGGSKEKHADADSSPAEPQPAHHHEPIIDKMRHNFGGSNQTFGEAEAEHAARDADYEAEHHGSHGGIFHNTAEAVSHAQYAAGDKFKAKQHAGYVQRHKDDAQNYGEEGMNPSYGF